MTGGMRFVRVTAVAGLILGGLSGAVSGARAQDDGLSRLVTGAIGLLNPFGSPAAAPPGKDDWSGESGSSGHPLMQADAIRAAAANFPNCIAGYWPDAARRGVTRETFETYATGLTPDLKIMDFVDSQPEFTKALWDYLDLLVSDARIKRGREILAANKATFDAVEKAYGVDRHVVAAIWGVESNYSTQIGERPVLRSVATLACVGRRQAYFKDEFLATLEILNRGDVTPEHLKGSWAGAFGPTQFMPTA
ncbi:MAG TPA: lytic murein transglycosylase, partial [Stellaceae bacterium]|nr:lytic murein transglycosylase [Stellaceae bacterium]